MGTKSLLYEKEQYELTKNLNVRGFTYLTNKEGIMEIILTIIFVALLFFALWIALALIIGFFKLLFSPNTVSSSQTPSHATDEIDGMNNGDYYNGPHGYSPMTGYPETQYGSGFDEDAEWNER